MATINVLPPCAIILLFSLLVVPCNGQKVFSSLPIVFQVTSSLPQSGEVLRAGEDTITVRWGLYHTPRINDSSYKTIKVKLCYAPVSQEDRPWRKTEDDLSRDRTCQKVITSETYSPSNNTFTWTIGRDIPTATYFVRAYVFDQDDNEVGYGQSTDAQKTSNLFSIRGIKGRTTSIDIASGVFSGFSVLSLAYFYYREKSKSKKLAAQAN